MFLTVKNISVTYNPINESNTFTSGDSISGQVILDVAKDAQIQSLSVKIEGKAQVCFAQRDGTLTVLYSDKEVYYSAERFFVREDETHGNEMLKDPSGQPYPSVVARGRHVYPFTFKLPPRHFPPTFKGSFGQIVYSLETKLSRSMQEGLKVLAEVQNSSSRAIKLKYCLYEKHSFLARGKRKLLTRDLLKEEGEPIEPNSKKTVIKVLSFPPSLTISVLTCRMLKVEYRLRVYLDVPYPEIKFPVVILPPQPVSAATNSNAGICNQPPGSNMYPNPPPMAPQSPPLNMVGPPGQFGPSVSHQSDPSAPPPYQEYQLYPELPDCPEKS